MYQMLRRNTQKLQNRQAAKKGERKEKAKSKEIQMQIIRLLQLGKEVWSLIIEQKYKKIKLEQRSLLILPSLQPM